MIWFAALAAFVVGVVVGNNFSQGLLKAYLLAGYDKVRKRIELWRE